jgi:urease accessory protein
MITETETAGSQPALGRGSELASAPSLLRMLHLGSASLPVGAYAYSQGMEYAIAEGWLPDPEAIQAWLSLQMRTTLVRVDLPIMQRLHAALLARDNPALENWNAIALACRETAELRMADLAMADALHRLCRGLAIDLPEVSPPVAQVTRFTQVALHWDMPLPLAAMAYSWSWLEQQMGAANRLLPLGQTRSQALLDALIREIPGILFLASQIDDDQIGSGLPGLAIASARHETLYSRLYRS